MADKIDEKFILSVLGQVNDPALKKDIVSLGYVQNLKINGSRVTFTLALPTPLFPSKEKMREDSERVLSFVPGISSVEISLKTEIQIEQNARGVSGVKHIIAVGRGKGGVGKSTVAVNLAAVFAEYGAKVGWWTETFMGRPFRL
jgi:ATP-binding protein involved in chromosome partitioning